MAGSRTLKLSILADVDNLKKNLDTGSKEVEGFGGKLEKFGKVAAAAFAAAAAAAAAYAGKLAIEGVKAAIEDEAAQNRLAEALKNVTGATNSQIEAIETQITKTSLATGVADDQLRPALQRLATATGSVKDSQNLLNLALDISAATGKSVETVSNALAKAYEGNTGALTRLGVGLSAAEIKSLGLDGAINQLSATFGGAAASQAETFEGRIQRLQVRFDETKETIGTALLPMVEKLLIFIEDTLIPGFEKAKQLAVDPIIKAFKDNEDALRDLWKFAKDYLIPIFQNGLVAALGAVGKTIAGIVSIIATVTSKIKELANDVIDVINKIIRAYNAIPLLPNIGTIPNIGTSGGGTGTNTVAPGGLPFGGTAGSAIPPTSGSTGNIPVTPTPSISTATPPKGAPVVTGVMPVFPTGGGRESITVGSSFDPSNFRRGESSGVVINVNSPSVIDEEGFTRAVILAMNNSQNRTGSGASQLIDR